MYALARRRGDYRSSLSGWPTGLRCENGVFEKRYIEELNQPINAYWY